MKPYSCTSIGVHVILIPNSDAFQLPRYRQSDLMQIAKETAAMSKCTYKALHVSADHMHVLFVCSDELGADTFLPAFAERTRQCIVDTGTSLEDFEWNERLHVTLLPPWHVEILASFVRDQDNFHSTRTLQEELDEVFLPNATVLADSEEHAPKAVPRFN
ncbi:MAG: hypothetical protein SGJ05_07605 [bacterium]|nr:hypothetical protein [bacterium]